MVLELLLDVLEVLLEVLDLSWRSWSCIVVGLPEEPVCEALTPLEHDLMNHLKFPGRAGEERWGSRSSRSISRTSRSSSRTTFRRVLMGFSGV